MGLGFRQFGFVGGDQKRTLTQRSIVKSEFFAEEFVILHGVTTLRAGDVDDQKQNGASLDMAEKVVAEPFAGVSTFHESGNIGQGEASLLRSSHHADVGCKRGEGVGGDFGTGGGEGGEETRFSGIGQAHQSHLRDGFEHEDKFPGFARAAVLGVARSLYTRLPPEARLWIASDRFEPVGAEPLAALFAPGEAA